MNWPLNWSKAYPELAVEGLYRVETPDFRVTEELEFTPSGEGEHLYLYIEKENTNTQWLASQLATAVGVPASSVSYAGLKDRRAITQQWFSIYWGLKPEPSFERFEQETGAKILRKTRHSKKLRRGQLSCNRFQLTLRDLQGEVNALEERLENIRQGGVPNYFGEQRFGFDGHNVERALQIFQRKRRERNRQKQGLYLSAARSYLFNWVLSQRVNTQQWQNRLKGEPEWNQEQPEASSGPLWGRGQLSSTDNCFDLETQLNEQFAELCNGLEHAGLTQERRLLVNEVRDFTWSWPSENVLVLNFELSAGCYATGVLRELGSIKEFRVESLEPSASRPE